MTKETLTSLIADKSIKMDQSALTLILTVLLKYGIAPIAAIYLGYVLMLKDRVIEKKDEIVVTMAREQTAATVKQTIVLENLVRVTETLGRNVQENTTEMRENNRKSTR